MIFNKLNNTYITEDYLLSHGYHPINWGEPDYHIRSLKREYTARWNKNSCAYEKLIDEEYFIIYFPSIFNKHVCISNSSYKPHDAVLLCNNDLYIVNDILFDIFSTSDLEGAEMMCAEKI